MTADRRHCDAYRTSTHNDAQARVPLAPERIPLCVKAASRVGLGRVMTSVFSSERGRF
jgi:hypothetical protein